MMQINIEGIKMNTKMYEIAEQAMKEAALARYVTIDPWFKNEEEYEEWAGDVLFELFCAGCEALGITFDFDNPDAPDAVFIEEKN